MKQVNKYGLKLQRKLLTGCLGLGLLLSNSAFGQDRAVAFPQMPRATRFRLAQVNQPDRKTRKRFGSLVLTQQPVLLDGKAYTEFSIGSHAGQPDSEKLPFTLRLVGDSLLLPLALYAYVPAAQKDRLLDSLGTKRLENTFFRFGAAVGTKWTCPTSYSVLGKWNTMTTQLREIRRTANGELLYMLAIHEEYYGVSDYEFWKGLVISRERGVVQLTEEGMIGGELIYVRDSEAVK